MNTIESTTQKICVIDARVSTDKQLFLGSLDDQEVVCKRYALQRQWNVLKTYSKSYSGRKEERDDFKLICKEIKQMRKNGLKVNYYLIKSIDRLTRLGSGVYESMRKTLQNMGVELVDAYGVIQPEINKLEHVGFEYEWSRQSPTQIAQIIEAERSKQEVSDILVRMMSAEISLAQSGYQVRRANDGFVNTEIIAEGKKVKIQVRDSNRAPFYEAMFELRAKGIMSDDDIVHHINAMGFLSKSRTVWRKEGKEKRAIGREKGNPLTVKQLQRIIQKPVYAGVICEKWTHNKAIWSKSEKLVDIDTFNRANRGKVYIKVNKEGNPELLYNYTLSEKPVLRRKKFNPLYLFDKMILCPECNKPFLTSASRGKSGKKFPAYHCSRNHKRISASKSDFEKHVTEYLRSLSITEKVFESFQSIILWKYETSKSKVADNNAKMLNTIKELEKEKETLLDQYMSITSPLIRKDVEKRIEKLYELIDETKERQVKIGVNKKDVVTFIKRVRKIMEHPEKTLANNRNPEHQRRLFNLVFDSLPTYKEITNGTPKLSIVFKVLAGLSGDKNQVVNQRGLKWNTFEEMVKKWNDAIR